MLIAIAGAWFPCELKEFKKEAQEVEVSSCCAAVVGS